MIGVQVVYILKGSSYQNGTPPTIITITPIFVSLFRLETDSEAMTGDGELNMTSLIVR
jgi:hypothetical protein